MQVFLAYLIESKAKIAIVNDLMNTKGESKGRIIYLLQGDGDKQFLKLELNGQIDRIDYQEPVVVFGGCAYSDSHDLNSLSLRMQKYHNNFSSLVLACDIHYPQYPKISDDLEFNSDPILPEEKNLKDIILEHSKIEGVSLDDPSFYCLTHIYPASLKQFSDELFSIDGRNLPYSFIPRTKLKSLYPNPIS